jgi:O-glycosyl hydrolase
LAVVLVNEKSRDPQQSISVANGPLPASLVVWTTSDAVALENTDNLAVSADGNFTVALPAQSVTTLVSDTAANDAKSVAVSRSSSPGSR